MNNKYEGLLNIPQRGKLIEEMNLFCLPRPLERPRQNKSGHFYTPRDNQKELYREVNYYAKSGSKVINYPVIVDCYFYFEYAGSKHKYPTMLKYGDIDNLQKSVYDAISAHESVIKSGLVSRKIIQNDSLIIGGECFKIFDQLNENGDADSYIVTKIWSVL